MAVVKAAKRENKLSNTILLDGNSDLEKANSLADLSSEISAYTSNLQLASSSELHQDLLFYEIQLDSMKNEVRASGDGSDDDLGREELDKKARHARIISAKIRAVEHEMERRRNNSC